jgi:hypothetical protein
MTCPLSENVLTVGDGDVVALFPPPQVAAASSSANTHARLSIVTTRKWLRGYAINPYALVRTILHLLRRSRGATEVILTICLVLCGVPNASAGEQAVETNAEPKWEIEFHSAGTLTGHSTNGTGALPGPGQRFITDIRQPSRLVSSWSFGDGAQLLNQVIGAFRPGVGITPLDPVMNSPIARQPNGVEFGVRLGRSLSHRLTVEFGVEYSARALDVTNDALVGLETTRATFVSTWEAFNGISPITQWTASSGTTMRGRDAHQVLANSALAVSLGTNTRLIPYITFGGGVLAHVGETPEVTFTGRYQAVFGRLGALRLEETDTVTVRSSMANTFVGIIGGGLKYRVSSRWGVRVDARDDLIPMRVDTLVDATPLPTAPTPQGFYFDFWSLQFSTFSGVPTNLSGPAMQGFKAFTGRGLRHQIDIAAGVFWRF